MSTRRFCRDPDIFAVLVCAAQPAAGHAQASNFVLAEMSRVRAAPMAVFERQYAEVCHEMATVHDAKHTG